jgi:Fibronectin type III domain
VPLVSTVNDTALRILWNAPTKPNGPIKGYYIYINGVKADPQTTYPIAYVAGGLQPYTVYSIQVRNKILSPSTWAWPFSAELSWIANRQHFLRLVYLH